MSAKTRIAAAAAFFMIWGGAAMAESCPTPTVVATVTGAPIFSVTSPVTFAFADVNDNTLYGLPLDGVVDSAGNLIAGVLDPQGCRPPLRGRGVMANQIVGLITQNLAIQAMNAAFGTSMPFLTITFDVTTDTFETSQGTAIIVQGLDQGE